MDVSTKPDTDTPPTSDARRGGVVGGRVFHDENTDGDSSDAPPPGMANVNVWLFSCDPSRPLDLATTPSNGVYRFANLTAGEYYLVAQPPAGYRFSDTSPAGDARVDDDVGGGGATGYRSVIDPEDGRTACFELDDGERTMDWNIGLWAVSSAPSAEPSASSAPVAASDGPTAGPSSAPITRTPSRVPTSNPSSREPTLAPTLHTTSLTPSVGPSLRPTIHNIFETSDPTGEPTMPSSFSYPTATENGDDQVSDSYPPYILPPSLEFRTTIPSSAPSVLASSDSYFDAPSSHEPIHTTPPSAVSPTSSEAPSLSSAGAMPHQLGSSSNVAGWENADSSPDHDNTTPVSGNDNMTIQIVLSVLAVLVVVSLAILYERKRRKNAGLNMSIIMDENEHMVLSEWRSKSFETRNSDSNIAEDLEDAEDASPRKSVSFESENTGPEIIIQLPKEVGTRISSSTTTSTLMPEDQQLSPHSETSRLSSPTFSVNSERPEVDNADKNSGHGENIPQSSSVNKSYPQNKLEWLRLNSNLDSVIYDLNAMKQDVLDSASAKSGDGGKSRQPFTVEESPAAQEYVRLEREIHSLSKSVPNVHVNPKSSNLLRSKLDLAFEELKLARKVILDNVDNSSDHSDITVSTEDSPSSPIIVKASGDLGMVLDKPIDGNGPVYIRLLHPMTPLCDKVQLNDKIIAVNGVDVQHLSPVDVYRLMSESGTAEFELSIVRAELPAQPSDGDVTTTYGEETKDESAHDQSVGKGCQDADAIIADSKNLDDIVNEANSSLSKHEMNQHLEDVLRHMKSQSDPSVDKEFASPCPKIEASAQPLDLHRVRMKVVDEALKSWSLKHDLGELHHGSSLESTDQDTKIPTLDDSIPVAAAMEKANHIGDILDNKAGDQQSTECN